MSCKAVDHCMNWVWNEGNEKKKRKLGALVFVSQTLCKCFVRNSYIIISSLCQVFWIL